MPRKNLIRSDYFPYHVTARGNNREVFPCGPEQAWAILNSNLIEIKDRYNAKIHAFVMMPNHFHLLLTTPREDIGIVMQHFMKTVTKTINSVSGRSGRVFGARYYGALVDHDLYFDCVLKYIYRNPIRAGFCANVDQFQYSSVNKALGNDSSFLCPIEPTFWHESNIPSGNIEAFLEWLNEPFKTEEEEAVRRGLKKLKFQPPKIVRLKREIRLTSPLKK